MQIMLAARQAGKTAAAILKANETKSYIVTWNRRRCLDILEHAEKLGVHIRNPVSWQELVDSNYSTGFVNDIVIDDVDMILQMLFKQKIHLVTATQEMGGMRL